PGCPRQASPGHARPEHGRRGPGPTVTDRGRSQHPMGTRPERAKARRQLRLVIDRLEGRDLPTAPSLLAGPVSSVAPDSLLAHAGPQATTAVSPQPTAHELAREKFVAKFSGSFLVGPGRFTDQASQTFIQGGGISSAFLHADLQMAAYTPV